MAHFMSYFDRDYLGHWDLGGRDITVTIREVRAGKLTAQGGRSSKKPVLYFDAKEKGLVLNKTCAKTVAAMYGNDTEAWIGKRITLFATTTTFGSETVDCIRIRPVVPKGPSRNRQQVVEAPPQYEPPSQDEVPPFLDENLIADGEEPNHVGE